MNEVHELFSNALVPNCYYFTYYTGGGAMIIDLKGHSLQDFLESKLKFDNQDVVRLTITLMTTIW